MKTIKFLVALVAGVFFVAGSAFANVDHKADHAKDHHGKKHHHKDHHHKHHGHKNHHGNKHHKDEKAHDAAKPADAKQDNAAPAQQPEAGAMHQQPATQQ